MCCVFRGRSAELLSYLRPNLETVVRACKQVVESKRLRRCFEWILALGNYVNGTTAQGSAYGFKLETLEKLESAKSSDGKMTMSAYVVRLLERDAGSPWELEKDLPDVTAAARISLPALEADVGELAKGIGVLSGEIKKADEEKAADPAGPSARLVEVMEPFRVKVTEEGETIKGLLKDAQQRVGEVIALFGEDPKKMAVEEFFGVFVKYMENVKTTHEHNVQAEEKRRKEQEKKEKEERRKAVGKPAATASSAAGGSGSVGGASPAVSGVPCAAAGAGPESGAPAGPGVSTLSGNFTGPGGVPAPAGGGGGASGAVAPAAGASSAGAGPASSGTPSPPPTSGPASSAEGGAAGEGDGDDKDKTKNILENLNQGISAGILLRRQRPGRAQSIMTSDVSLRAQLRNE